MKTENNFAGFGWFAVVILFWVFWWQGGWYRVDCTLGTKAACDLIANEYVKKLTP